MIVKVHMFAFSEDRNIIREVNIPDVPYKNTAEVLDKVFYWGQNDLQPQPIYSVSCGDVIEYKNEYYLVSMVGFKKLSEKEFGKIRPPTPFRIYA